jgi:hypothetical protein
MICANFGNNWPSSSGEEKENVKVLTERRTDRQTKGNQKSSLEFQLR